MFYSLSKISDNNQADHQCFIDSQIISGNIHFVLPFKQIVVCHAVLCDLNIYISNRNEYTSVSVDIRAGLSCVSSRVVTLQLK
jgi:hypothetical protein